MAPGIIFIIIMGVVLLKAIKAFTYIAVNRSNNMGGNNQEVAALKAEVAQLRQQMLSLQDTTTQYDISFDTALQRMENRVQHIEQQQQQQRIGV